MDISYLKMNILTQTAICALKNAYAICSDEAAKESIITAVKAINTLHQDLEKHIMPATASASDSDYDASEYCVAV